MAETPRIELLVQELAANVNPDFSRKNPDFQLNQYRIIGLSKERVVPNVPLDYNKSHLKIVLQFDGVKTHSQTPNRHGAWYNVAALGFSLEYKGMGAESSNTEADHRYDAEAEPVITVERLVHCKEIRGARGSTLPTSSNPRDSRRDIHQILTSLDWAGALLYQAVETAKKADFDYFTLISHTSIDKEVVRDGERRTQSKILSVRYDDNAKARGFKYDPNTKLFIKDLKS